MRKALSWIVLGSLAAPAAAQPGQTPPVPAPAPPYPAPTSPYPEPAPAPPPGEQSMPSPGEQPMPPPMSSPRPPSPTATRATFVSTGEARWDVRIDNNAVCTTPCSMLIDPLHFVTLAAQDRTQARLSVGYLPPGDVVVQARPRAEGAFAAGVVFTTFSGLGLATGITLTAVGCATDRPTMCKAGLITGVASGAALYLSIDLLLRSLPRVDVGPVQARPYAAASAVGLAGRF
jgi:hypothetical protein